MMLPVSEATTLDQENRPTNAHPSFLSRFYTHYIKFNETHISKQEHASKYRIAGEQRIV